MRLLSLIVLACMEASFLYAQSREAKIDELDRKLTEARQAAAALQKTIDSLAIELASLRAGNATPVQETPPLHSQVERGESGLWEQFRAQILGADIGRDERNNKLSERPELFVQARYQTLPVSGTDVHS